MTAHELEQPAAAPRSTHTPEAPPRPGFRMGQVFGIEVRIDASLSIIFLLIAANLGFGVIPNWHPDWSPLLTWTVALSAAVLFFVSVLVHELSHALVARRYGVEIRWVTLFLFGGLAHMEGDPPSPRAEFFTAVVGPVTSLAIGVAATLLGSWMAASVVTEAALEAPAQALGSLGPVATLLLWLGPINVILAVFNIVPGFPLDGGRVLRSVLWWATSDVVKATRWATLAGQAFAWVLMGWGAIQVFHGAFVGGLWLLLIGWFLNNAARMSYTQLYLRHVLSEVPARRVMNTQFRRIAPELSVDALVRDHVIPTDERVFVVERDGRLVGMVSAQDVKQVPQDRWPDTPVSAIMRAAADVPTLSPDVSAKEVLDEMGRRNLEQIPLVEDGHVVGLGRRRDLVEWAALQESRAA